jgi:hypothetical protein
MLLGSDAVLNDCVEKRVAGRSAEGKVSNFPIHPVLLAEEAVKGQLFERKYATESEQIFETGCQEYIGVKIEATQTIDGKIPEKVVTLNSYGERVEHGSVSGKLGVNEFFDLSVIEKQVLKIGIEQTQGCRGCLSQERQVCALVRLDDTPWNSRLHDSSPLRRFK